MNTIAATRWVVRLGIPVLIVSIVVLYVNYGLLGVPQGMDTMVDTHPPGTLCLIQKRPSSVTPGAVVFVDLDDGGTVLSRVVEVSDDETFTIRHDNRKSVFLYLEERGPYRVDAVRGIVVSMLVNEAQGEPKSVR